MEVFEFVDALFKHCWVKLGKIDINHSWVSYSTLVSEYLRVTIIHSRATLKALVNLALAARVSK